MLRGDAINATLLQTWSGISTEAVYQMTTKSDFSHVICEILIFRLNFQYLNMKTRTFNIDF